MGEIVDAAHALVSPLEKLIGAVQSAIGKAYEPRSIRKLTDAKVYEIAKIGQALRENSDIPIIYDKGSISIDTTDFDEFAKRAQNRLAFQELTKQRNIESVIDIAYSELEGQAAVTDEPIDPDWIISFFNSVEDISNEQIQQLWGKLLAGEIKKPNSFSKRTLNVLKNLTQKEANIFQHISPYVLRCSGDRTKSFDDYFLPSDAFSPRDLLEKYSISFPEILVLHEAGLISENDWISTGVIIQPGETEYICGMKEKMQLSNTDSTETQIFCSAYILTEAGKELLPIVLPEGDTIDLDEYMQDFLNYIKEVGRFKPETAKQYIEIKVVPH